MRRQPISTVSSAFPLTSATCAKHLERACLSESVGGQPELALAEFALALGAVGFLVALRDLAHDGADCRIIAGITQVLGCR